MPDVDPNSPVARIMRTLRWLTATTMLLAVVVGYVAVSGKQSADRSNAALCALKADLEKRVENSEAFLAEHPRGIPGIPAATLRTSQAQQRRTIVALAEHLDC